MRANAGSAWHVLLWSSGLLVAISILIAGPFHAQIAGTGAIAGKVTDPSGAVVPEATLQITSQQTDVSRTGKTTPEGVFRVTLLPPGNYSVTVEAPGFKKNLVRDIRVLATETAVVNIQLEVGATSAEVNVSATPELVQAESAALGRATDADVIVALPLANRNFTQILALSPGVSADLPNAGALGKNNQNVSANGAGTTYNSFQFNGVDSNNISENSASGFPGEVGLAVPAPDTIQEFKVQTGQYDAAYGRSVGANVDLVSKSGSNRLHGSLWEFFRNDDLNANDFFLNRNHQPRPVLKQNQFGGAVGGPIRKDKTFFFVAYQGTIQRNGVSDVSKQTASLPPLTNDRSAAALGALFGGQRGLFGGVPVASDGSNINPVALALLNFKFPNGQYAIPSPQSISGGVGQFSFSAPAHFNENQITANLDQIISERNQLAARFFYSRAPQSTPFSPFGANLPGWGEHETDTNLMLVLSDIHTFSSTVVNIARLGYMRFNGNLGADEPISNSQVGMTTPTGHGGIPSINVLGLFRIGAPGLVNLVEATNTFVAQDTISIVTGRHSLRIGAEAKRHQINAYPEFADQGFLTFLSFPDFLLGKSAAQNGTPLSNVIASFAEAGIFKAAYRVTDLAGFFQDDIKVTSRFTLNAGLRYDFFGPPSEAHGLISNFDPKLADPQPPAAGNLLGLVMPGNYSGTLPAGVTKDSHSGLWSRNLKDLGPRIGVAYRLLDKHALVLRAGYGIYYQRPSNQPTIQTQGNTPFYLSGLASGPANGAATLQVPFPFALPSPSDFPVFIPFSTTNPANVKAISRSLKDPSTQQYSVNLQYEFVRDFLWEVGYVGSNTKNLDGTVLFNQALIATAQNVVHGQTTTTLGNLVQRVPFLAVSTGAQMVATLFDSNYNSLQTSVTKRFSHGLNFQASYTWAKGLGDTGGGGGASSTELSGFTNDQTNPKNAYGPLDYDRKHRFVVNFVYRLPNIRGGSSFTQHLLSGWQFSGLVVFQSGLPITIIDPTAGTVYGLYGTLTRAQCTGASPASSGSVTSRLGSWFNPVGFTHAPAIGDGTGFGNCGAGIIRGPDERNLDLGISRTFRIKEKSNLMFRAEFFNLTNTPKFGLPNNNAAAGPSFGVISSTVSNPRIIQFALKYTF